MPAIEYVGAYFAQGPFRRNAGQHQPSERTYSYKVYDTTGSGTATGYRAVLLYPPARFGRYSAAPASSSWSGSTGLVLVVKETLRTSPRGTGPAIGGATDLDFDLARGNHLPENWTAELGRSDCSPQNPCTAIMDKDGWWVGGPSHF